MINNKELEKDLTALLNKHSVENVSNTPDYILAKYLMGCLEQFDIAVMARTKWHGLESDNE